MAEVFERFIENVVTKGSATPKKTQATVDPSNSYKNSAPTDNFLVTESRKLIKQVLLN